jgi:hemolysin activation/secretion protein
MKAVNQYSIRFFGLATVSALTLGLAMPAHAQLDNATTIADPSQAQERLRQPEMQPREAPQIDVKQARPQNAPSGAEKIRFTLNAITFQGAGVYSDDELRSVYADKLGKEVSLTDVYGIADDLTKKYRNDGYILTQVVIPPQEISNGTPKLRVVEGFVNKVTLQKENADAPINMKQIESYAAKISRGKNALNARDLERQLLLINDLPGVTARSVLSPAPDAPGGADMLIIVSYDPFDGQLSLDDYGSRYLGPVQIGAAGTLNSMLGQNEAISGQVIVAPQSWYELAYGSVGYEQPIGDLGTKAHINLSATDTEPGYDLKEFDVKGRSYLINVGATHPFIRSRSQNLYGRLNLDWRRVKSENNIEEDRKDRISALRLGGRYDFIDTLIGAAANTVDLEVSKGLNLLGASDEGDENLTRSEGDPQFTKLEAEIQRLQRVTSGVNLLLAARGQVASNALLSSEEFSVGGINSGRGYDPSEITGDEGISGKVELQWNDPYRLDPQYVDSYQLFGFYDIGKVWNDDATTNDLKSDSLASVGGGVRFNLPYEVDAGFAVAFPLTREPQTANDHDPKFYFNVSKKF